MKSNTNLIIAILVIAVAVLAFVAYDRRNPIEKAGDSGRDIKDAVEPRSPAEKIGDSVKDTVRDIKN